MVTIACSWDRADLAFLGDRRVERAILKALGMAGGDAIRAMRAETSRRVRGKKRFRAKRVSRALSVAYPRNKADIHALEWRMDVRGDPVPLGELPHRQTKRGVMVEVNAGRRKLVRSAFVARMESGHKGIFQRFGPKRPTSKGRYKGHNRQAIQEAWTTRVTDVVADEGLIPAVQGRALTVLNTSFERLFALELDKLA